MQLSNRTLLINNKHTFKVLVGFYWGGRSTELSETKIVEFSYLLFPGARPVSVEKMIYVSGSVKT